MYKKITNNKIYDVANHILDESNYKLAAGNKHFFSPVFNTENTRKMLELDENWEYTGAFKTNAEKGSEKDIRVQKLINSVYEMLVKNDDTAKLIANSYYSNRNYVSNISDFVGNNIFWLDSKNLDYKDEEINVMLEKAIDEFVINFNVHYN